MSRLQDFALGAGICTLRAALVACAVGNEGSYTQELDAWRKTTHPTPVRPVVRCPWPRCPHLYHEPADLARHLDIIHHGATP